MLNCLISLRTTFFYLFKPSMGVWPLIGKIHAREYVCRYLFDGQYRVDNQSVKHKAFIPPRDSSELSVYRIFELSSLEISRIGKYFVETISRRHRPTVMGEAEIEISHLKSIGRNLIVKASRCPHPRHANILNLPMLLKSQAMGVAYEEKKQEQKNIAQGLASIVSRLKIY